jgi:hypothetical protein
MLSFQPDNLSLNRTHPKGRGKPLPLPLYSTPSYKRSPYKGRIHLSEILGRRRPVGFVRESYPIRGGNL